MPPPKKRPQKASPASKNAQTAAPASPVRAAGPVAAAPAATPDQVGVTLSSALKSPVATARALLCGRAYFWTVVQLLLLFQVAAGVAIILKVPYTKIDWDAYMQQARMFLDGERDYSKIEGETGPLVYPALHLYIYSFFYEYLPASGREKPAQFIFLLVENITFALVAYIYWLAGRDRHVPQWLLIPLVLSKRSHSIYLLRLFNDPLAMVLFYGGIVLMMHNWWKMGSFFYALALGVKMNILLPLPGLIVIWFQYRGLVGTLDSLILTTFVHIGLAGINFCDTSDLAYTYVNTAFNFGREFLYEWTVNWRFVPENIFLSKPFAIALLVGQVVALIAFGWWRWSPLPGGVPAVLAKGLRDPKSLFFPSVLPTQLSAAPNLIGMLFARSLHYQFYAWYFHQLPLLLWLGGGWGEPMLM